MCQLSLYTAVFARFTRVATSGDQTGNSKNSRTQPCITLTEYTETWKDGYIYMEGSY